MICVVPWAKNRGGVSPRIVVTWLRTILVYIGFKYSIYTQTVTISLVTNDHQWRMISTVYLKLSIFDVLSDAVSDFAIMPLTVGPPWILTAM